MTSAVHDGDSAPPTTQESAPKMVNGGACKSHNGGAGDTLANLNLTNPFVNELAPETQAESIQVG